ncbi:hypothetical protein GPECTOR_6g500 [Gonium pectorale]|uniref:Cytochrome P450 n=1 Tax=Gonium pectorale TaxID=33097 RepID=A0A150GUZ9_GONPE|nr:hypothetical protein GPECTOR_6g500 [Gonium pectorale]|eukprot:KXZ53583.1 hypothetical protein GPECTOR_6g500 [Gonium pectorale]
MAVLAILFGLGLAQFLWAALNPFERWRFRAIPGPFALPLLGNLHQIASEDLTAFVGRASREYGKICKIWFGSRPWIVVADPELVRNGPDWRLARRAFETSIIRASSLSAHLPAVQRCVAAFLPRLEAAAASGQPLQLAAALGELALASVGEVAYGVDFGTGKREEAVEREAGGGGSLGGQLMAAIREAFDCLEVNNASVYLPLEGWGRGCGGWMLPGLNPLWYWLAARLPDAGQRRHEAARARLHDISRRLIRQWQDSRAAAAGVAAAPGGAAGKGEAATAPAAGNGAGAGGGSPSFAEVGGGISGSSFMAAMLEGRQGARNGEERLTDRQASVIAQCLTFMMAGSDTTASTLAFTIFLLATHPEAQNRLTAELDTHFAAVAAAVAPGGGGCGAGPDGAEAEVEAAEAEDVLPKLPYLDAVLSESMRLYPSASLLVREAATDLDLGEGKVVPKGYAIVLATHTLHHDPALWPDAEAFRPERFLPEGAAAGLGPAHPAAYAPFGMGPRMCVGNKIATMVS